MERVGKDANEYALKRAGFLAEYSVFYDLTTGSSKATAASAANAEDSPATGSTYAIRYQSAMCGPAGHLAPTS